MNALLCRAVLGAFLLIAALTTAPAQDWPSRNVTVVVPVPAGVASDIIARVVFDQVGRQVGHTFVVENRPGAGGSIGGNTVAKATPDGYRFLFGGLANLAQNQTLYKQPLYNAATDFTPVGLLTDSPRVLIALLIAALLATAVAFTVQSWAQQYIPATHTALLLTMEPVFAWLTSFIFLGERLGMRSTLGAVLILAGIALTELLPQRIQPTPHEAASLTPES